MELNTVFENVSSYLSTALVGWVAYELRALRKEVHDRVHKAECDKDMGAHCKRLENVESKAAENKTDIAVIKNRLRIDT